MAITAADIRTAVKQELFGAGVTERPYQTLLTAISLTADDTLDVLDGDAWDVGDIGEFDDGEQVFVKSVSTNEITVVRGWKGTAADRAIDDVLTKNPKYSIQQIDQALQHVLLDLRPDIYDLETKDLSYDPSTRWYPLSAAGDDRVYDVISVYYKPTNEDHPAPIDAWMYDRDVSSAGFTATHGLIIPQSISLATGTTFYAVVKKEIQAVADLADNMKTMIVMGVVYHLLGAADIRRIHDPGKRTDRTVQPGSEARTSIWFLREYQRRKDQIAADLRAREGDMVKSRIAQRGRRFRV
jgi:hypothetical protein